MTRQTIAGRYALEQPLGTGAMSSVWLARDERLDRHVAVKVLAAGADSARFEREARAVAGLAHPHVAQLYDYGEAEGQQYMILEYLQGGTLEDRLAGGRPLADDDTTRIAREIAAGLAHAHTQGLVHRDLKPANVLFDAEGRAKIADFGIVRTAGGGTLTEAGTVLGTAATISPEQAAGRPATPASDVYSFGAILYRMLTGRGPFVSDSAMELVRMHRDEAAPPLADLRPDAPPSLAALADAALAKDPRQRPADGNALVAALGGALGAATVAASATRAWVPEDARTQVRPAARAPSSPRRRALVPLLLAAAAALAVGGVAAALALTDGGGSASDTAASISLPTPTAAGTGSTPLPTSATLPTTAAAPAPPTTTQESTTLTFTSTSTSTEASTTASMSTAATTTATTSATTTLPPTSTESTTIDTTAPSSSTMTATTTSATTTATTGTTP